MGHQLEQHDGPEERSLQDGEIEIPASVVSRAFGLLEILESIVSILAKKPHAGTSAFSNGVLSETASESRVCVWRICSEIRKGVRGGQA